MSPYNEQDAMTAPYHNIHTVALQNPRKWIVATGWKEANLGSIQVGWVEIPWGDDWNETLSGISGRVTAYGDTEHPYRATAVDWRHTQTTGTEVYGCWFDRYADAKAWVLGKIQELEETA